MRVKTVYTGTLGTVSFWIEYTAEAHEEDGRIYEVDFIFDERDMVRICEDYDQTFCTDKGYKEKKELKQKLLEDLKKEEGIICNVSLDNVNIREWKTVRY